MSFFTTSYLSETSDWNYFSDAGVHDHSFTVNSANSLFDLLDQEDSYLNHEPI
jgi:hypothetical protein